MSRILEISLHAERAVGYISNMVSNIGDQPGHELSQRVFALHITSDHPDFNGFYTTNFVQADEINGTGSFWGYAAWPLMSGETVYIKFKSNTRREFKDNGDWVTSFEGTFEFVSGNGKYADIKGACQYAGSASSTCSHWDSKAKFTY